VHHVVTRRGYDLEPSVAKTVGGMGHRSERHDPIPEARYHYRRAPDERERILYALELVKKMALLSQEAAPYPLKLGAPAWS
jgi:hypothetical protein